MLRGRAKLYKRAAQYLIHRTLSKFNYLARDAGRHRVAAKSREIRRRLGCTGLIPWLGDFLMAKVYNQAAQPPAPRVYTAKAPVYYIKG